MECAFGSGGYDTDYTMEKEASYKTTSLSDKKCCECSRIISAGEEYLYQHFVVRNDEDAEDYSEDNEFEFEEHRDVCLDCESILEHVFEERPPFGWLWGDTMANAMYGEHDGLGLRMPSERAMELVTPAAKDKLIALFDEYNEGFFLGMEKD